MSGARTSSSSVGLPGVFRPRPAVGLPKAGLPAIGDAFQEQAMPRANRGRRVNSVRSQVDLMGQMKATILATRPHLAANGGHRRHNPPQETAIKLVCRNIFRGELRDLLHESINLGLHVRDQVWVGNARLAACRRCRCGGARGTGAACGEWGVETVLMAAVAGLPRQAEASHRLRRRTPPPGLGVLIFGMERSLRATTGTTGKLWPQYGRNRDGRSR